MKRFLRRILDFLHLDGRDTAVFLLSLLLASSIWLIHNLTIRYTLVMRVQVSAHSRLDGHTELSANAAEVVARCKTSGFNFVRAGWQHEPRRIDFAPDLLHPADSELFYVLTSSLQESADALFGENTTLDRFITDTLWFVFPRRHCKKVPVRVADELHFASQYMLTEPVRTDPDSVLVYADPLRLERIESVSTEPLRGIRLRSDHHGSLDLIAPAETQLSTDKVHFHLSVSRYVEWSGTLPVEVRGVPAGRSLRVMPSSVRAVLRCTLPLQRDPSEEVRFYVDYSDFLRSPDGRCLVQHTSLPKSVLHLRVEPQVAGCLEEDLPL